MKLNYKFLLSFFLLLWFSCTEKKKFDHEYNIIATITMKKNDVKRRVHREIEWKNININDNLYQRDFLRTMSDSNAIVEFNDKSSLKVAENSLVVIERPEQVHQNINTKIFLQEGTLDRQFNSLKNEESVSEIKTDRLTTYISSKSGNVGIKYNKDDKLKIAVYSGKTKIKTIVKEDKSIDGASKNKNDLLEVAVYEGKADVSIKTIDENMVEKTTTSLELKKDEIIQIDHTTTSRTKEPVKNTNQIDIIKEDFVETVKEIVETKIEENKIEEKKVEENVWRLEEKKAFYLSWQKISDADKYIVDISDTRHFRRILDTKFTNENTIKLESGDLKPGTYWWQVAPIIGGEIKEYYMHKSFIVR